MGRFASLPRQSATNLGVLVLQQMQDHTDDQFFIPDAYSGPFALKMAA